METILVITLIKMDVGKQQQCNYQVVSQELLVAYTLVTLLSLLHVT